MSAPAARHGRTAAWAVLTALLLAACQAKQPVAVLTQPGKSAALRTMERIAMAAQQCWFGSRDPAFSAYRMSNELGSFSGRPRFLLVPAKSMESRPVLVVQAQGQSPTVEVFGPLLDGPAGARISSDIDRWSKGDRSCAATA